MGCDLLQSAKVLKSTCLVLNTTGNGNLFKMKDIACLITL